MMNISSDKSLTSYFLVETLFQLIGVIMDNASFHCHPRIEEVIREEGVD